MFFSDLSSVHARPVCHTIIWAWTMFCLKDFSIDIHKRCKSNHYLHYGHVRNLGQYLWQILAILFGTFVFGNAFFSTFWRLWKLVFWWKLFQNLILMFSFYPKNGRTDSSKTSITQTWLVVESCPTSFWVTFLIFFWLVYDVPSHLNGLILAWSTSLQLC